MHYFSEYLLHASPVLGVAISRFRGDGLVYSSALEVIKCPGENDRGRLLEYNKAARFWAAVLAVQLERYDNLSKVCRRYLLPVTPLDVYTLPVIQKINAKKFLYFIPMDAYKYFFDKWS